MNEKSLQPTLGPAAIADNNGTFGSTVAATLENALAQALAGGIQEPQVQPAPPAQPVQVPPASPTDAPVEVKPAPAENPPDIQVPDDRPVVSTEPVAKVADRFRTPQTPVPETPQTPATDPGSDPAAPENLDPKANDAWKHLKQLLKASRADNETLRQQLDQVTKGAGAVAQERAQFADAIKQRDDQIKELEERIGKLDLAATPEFRQQYDKPIDDVVTQIKDVLAAESDLQPEAIADVAENLLEASDTEFNQMVGKLPASVQGSLLDKRVKFANLMAARDHAVREWRTTQSGVAAVDDQQKLVERATRRRDMAEAAIEFATKITPPQDRVSVLGESVYADDVRNVTESFRGFMQEAKDEEIARAAYQGFLVPVMQRQVAFLAQALEEMRNYAYTLKGAAVPPVSAIRLKGAEPSPAPAPAPVVREGQHFAETVEQTIAGALAGLSR